MHPLPRLVAIDMDGTLLDSVEHRIQPRTARALEAAVRAGIAVAIATGRRTGFTTPLLEGVALPASTPLITSNGAVVRTLGGEPMDQLQLPASVARGLVGLLRGFGVLVFTFDRPGRKEVILESMDEAGARIAPWVEANRASIDEVRPLEAGLGDGEDPIQGMVAGGVEAMRRAERALATSPLAGLCACVKTEYPARDLSILDLLPPGISKGWALERLAARLGVEQAATMAIGDNWNDMSMFEWAGQPVLMANAALELRTMAKMRGWRQAPSNEHDGVAVVLEELVARAGNRVSA